MAFFKKGGYKQPSKPANPVRPSRRAKETNGGIDPGKRPVSLRFANGLLTRSLGVFAAFLHQMGTDDQIRAFDRARETILGIMVDLRGAESLLMRDMFLAEQEQKNNERGNQ